MATYTFNEARRATLGARWAGMVITRKKNEIDSEARKIIAKRDMYRAVEDVTGVPWAMIGVIDDREGGISKLGTRHLHCGDSLSNYTTHVPKGRPQVGHGPPFTWKESAVDALKLKKFDKISNWTIERQLHELEPYNGLGYYNKGIPSPYIWSCTNRYDPPAGPGGKYTADHVFSPGVVDTQTGCAPLLKRIADLEKTAVTTEKDMPTTVPASDTVKKASVPAGTAATTTVIVAAEAVKQGVPVIQIIFGILFVAAIIGAGIYIWHQKRK